MGGVLSTNHLTETVTLNRIRQACQRDSTLPYQVRLHHVQLLANDLNKLGFDIPIKDGKGKDVPVDKVCDRVTEVLPNVESVCMYNVKSKGALHDGIKKLVGHFNKHYGSNIQMYKNIFGPKNKENLRPYENICDDLYMAQDRIYRNLTNYPDLIKNRLKQAIGLLGAYKTALDADFDKYLVNISNSRQTDNVAKQMRAVKALRQSMTGMLNKQLTTLEQNYKNLILAHKNKIFPLLGQARVYMNRYSGLPFKPLTDKPVSSGTVLTGGGGNPFSMDLMQSIGTFDNKLNALMLPSIFLGSAAEQCQECLSKFNISVNEFYKKPDYERRAIVMNKYLPIIAKARRQGGGEREVVRILECAKQLLDDKSSQNCSRAIVGHSTAYEANKNIMDPSTRCGLLSADPSVCSRDPDCHWDPDPTDPKCVSSEESINRFAAMMSQPVFGKEDNYGEIPSGDDERILAHYGLPAIAGPENKGLFPGLVPGLAYPAVLPPGLLGGKKRRKSKTGKRKKSRRGRRKSRGKK